MALPAPTAPGNACSAPWTLGPKEKWCFFCHGGGFVTCFWGGWRGWSPPGATQHWGLEGGQLPTLLRGFWPHSCPRDKPCELPRSCFLPPLKGEVWPGASLPRCHFPQWLWHPYAHLLQQPLRSHLSRSIFLVLEEEEEAEAEPPQTPHPSGVPAAGEGAEGTQGDVQGGWHHPLNCGQEKPGSRGLFLG